MSFNLQTPQGINEARHEIKAILQLIDNYVILVKKLFKLLRLKNTAYFIWRRAKQNIEDIQFYIKFIENIRIVSVIESLKTAVKNRDWDTFNLQRTHLYEVVKEGLQEVRLLPQIETVIAYHLESARTERDLYAQSILEKMHYLFQGDFKFRSFPELSVLKILYKHYIIQEGNLRLENKSAQLWRSISYLHLGAVTIFSLVLGYYFIYLYLFEINKQYLINEIITPQSAIYIAAVLGVEFIILPFLFYTVFNFLVSYKLNEKYIQPYFKPITAKHFILFCVMPPIAAVLLYCSILFIFNHRFFAYRGKWWDFFCRKLRVMVFSIFDCIYIIFNEVGSDYT